MLQPSLWNTVEVINDVDMKTQKIAFEKVIEQFSQKKILVVGDVMLDRYTLGTISRISPEAPVPVLEKVSEKCVLGGAANVANNIAALGAKPFLFGVVGEDNAGETLLQLLKRSNIAWGGVIADKNRPTTVKHRFVVGEDHQLLRVDEEVHYHLTANAETKLLEGIRRAMKVCDGVVLSDYAKGVFSPTLTEKILLLARAAHKLVIADIKSVNKQKFAGVDIVTPNVAEGEEMTGLHAISEIGMKLVEMLAANILLTRGSEGMTVFNKTGGSIEISAKKVKAFDVSGAGDTVIATLILGMTSGLSLEDASRVANNAGGLVVQKPGVATVTLEELKTTLEEDHHVESVDMVPKLWGYEKWLENNDKYCCKLLSLKKGYQCSLHKHKIKDEMFFITQGHVRLEVGKKVMHMLPGSFVRITCGVLHRFRGIEDSIMIEVSTHHEDSDSYRVEESKKVEEMTV